MVRGERGRCAGRGGGVRGEGAVRGERGRCAGRGGGVRGERGRCAGKRGSCEGSEEGVRGREGDVGGYEGREGDMGKEREVWKKRGRYEGREVISASSSQVLHPLLHPLITLAQPPHLIKTLTLVLNTNPIPSPLILTPVLTLILSPVLTLVPVP